MDPYAWSGNAASLAAPSSRVPSVTFTEAIDRGATGSVALTSKAA